MNGRRQMGAIKYLFPLIAFLAVAILLAVGLRLDPKHIPSTLIGKPAPAFELPTLFDSSQRFSPSQLLGQRWILNVWASWCVGCRVEHPLLNQLAEQTNIPLVGLNYKDPSDDALAWLSQRGDPYTAIAADLSGDVGIDWGVYGAPETFVIDEKGVVIYKHIGPLNVDVLEREVLPLFSAVDK